MRRNLTTTEAMAVYDRAVELQRENGGRLREQMAVAKREIFGGPAFDDGTTFDDSNAVSRRLLAKHRVSYRPARTGNAAVGVLIPMMGVALIVGALVFGFLRGPVADFCDASAATWSSRIAN